MKIRAVAIVLALIVAALFYHSSTERFPYNLYEALLIASYPVVMEVILYLLPRKGIIRLIGVCFSAIVLPPLWAASGIILLFPEPQKVFASSDVLLPFLWILLSIIFYIYSIAILTLEKLQPRG